jgi:hypothetical protein
MGAVRHVINGAHTADGDKTWHLPFNYVFAHMAVMLDDPFDHRVDAKDQWQGRGKRLVRMVAKTLVKRSGVSMVLLF